jgi:hypothetical protein
MTGAASAPGVSPTARVLVRAATTTLPSGALRERYRREHLGELSALPPTDQIHYALGALATSWALRRALNTEKTMATIAIRSTKPLLCRLNLHHRWIGQYNPAGEAYRRCRLCGKDDPGNQGPPPYYVAF